MCHVLKTPSLERKERFSLSSYSKKENRNYLLVNVLKEEIQLVWLAMRLSVGQALCILTWHIMIGWISVGCPALSLQR